MKLSLPLLAGVLLTLGCSFIQAKDEPQDIGTTLRNKLYPRSKLPDQKPIIKRYTKADRYEVPNKCKEDTSGYVIYIKKAYEYERITYGLSCVKGKLVRGFRFHHGPCTKEEKDPKQLPKEKHLWQYCTDGGTYGLEVCDGSDKHVNCEDVPGYSTDFRQY